MAEVDLVLTDIDLDDATVIDFYVRLPQWCSRPLGGAILARG